MYYEIEYGWSSDPEKYFKLLKSSYPQARRTMQNIFRSYQRQLESGERLENFTCILKQKGTDHDIKERPKEEKPEEENYRAKWGIFA